VIAPIVFIESRTYERRLSADFWSREMGLYESGDCTSPASSAAWVSVSRAALVEKNRSAADSIPYAPAPK
jgi:hypothetical protein